MRSAAAAMPTVKARRRMAHFTAGRYRTVSHVITGFTHSPAPRLKKKSASTGAINMEKVRAPSKANATVQAIGFRSFHQQSIGGELVKAGEGLSADAHVVSIGRRV